MIYIKQYGKQRCGTNYARNIIERNFDGVRVLSNILGHKHGHMEPYSLWIDNHWRYPGIVESQGVKTDLTVAELRKAALGPDMRWVISIRNPYAFIVGIFKHWQRLDGRNWFDDPEADTTIAWQCHDYCEKYEAWERIHRDAPTRSAIMRHEDIVCHDINTVTKTLGRRLGLERNEESKRGISGCVEATDDRDKVVSKTGFDRTWYSHDGYLDLLKPHQIEIIRNEINWEVLGSPSYKYGPDTLYQNWVSSGHT